MKSSFHFLNSFQKLTSNETKRIPLCFIKLMIKEESFQLHCLIYDCAAFERSFRFSLFIKITKINAAKLPAADTAIPILKII